MPSSEFSSDYLAVQLSASSEAQVVRELFDLINEFPEGSARRMELEAEFLLTLSKHVRTLADRVRKSNKVTLYD